MPLPEPTKLPLREGPKRDHIFGIARHYGGCGISDCSSYSTTASTPVHIRKLDLRDAERASESNRVVPIITIRGKPVDIFDAQPSISDGFLNRFQRELKFTDRRLPSFVIPRLADANDGHFVLNCVVGHCRTSLFLGNRDRGSVSCFYRPSIPVPR